MAAQSEVSLVGIADRFANESGPHIDVVSRGADPSGVVGRAAELESLGELLGGARKRRSGVLVVRGEAGIGKSVLLDFAAARAEGFNVMRVSGVESEVELPYAALQQLCRPFIDRVPALPAPQRAALLTAFGLDAGSPPNRFLVGLAALQLLAGLAEEQPVLAIVDDAQWLDRVSVQTIEFVARRLLAEQIVLLIAERDAPDRGDFLGLPEMRLQGLGNAEAAVLLGSVMSGPTDPRVRERVLAESHGNPLALLELPRTWTSAELVEGLADGRESGRRVCEAVAIAACGFAVAADAGRRRAARRPDAVVACGRAPRAWLGRGEHGGGRGTHRVRCEGSISSSVGSRRGLPRGVNTRASRRS
jgi:AAA ATPase domain